MPGNTLDVSLLLCIISQCPMPMPSPPPPPQDNIMFEITEANGFDRGRIIQNTNSTVCLLVNICRYCDIVCATFQVILAIYIK
jgi:hypothetical protein